MTKPFDPMTDAADRGPLKLNPTPRRPQPRGNQTGFKSLDALGRDPRVELIENEGRTSQGGDGLWLYTAKGYCNGDIGSHIIHEDTVAVVKSQARGIRPCDCPDCIRLV